MTDLVLTTVVNSTNVSAINSNFDKIEAMVNSDLLHTVDGGNTMHQDLDMNGNAFLNIGVLNVQGLTINGVPVTISNLGALGPNSVGTSQIIDGTVTDSKIVSVSGTKISFLQDGTGATTRNILDKLKDIYNAKDFGVVADGVTDNRTKLLAAINAAGGKELKLPAGTIVVSSFDIPSGASLVGDAKGTTIKRLSTDTSTYLLGIASAKISLKNLTVDGNKSLNSNGAHNILITGGAQDWSLDSVTSINAKGASGTYGCGVAIVSTSDAANFTYSSLKNSKFSNNDVHGIYISIASYWKIINCVSSGNGIDGISVVNFAAPASPTELYWSIADCDSSFNGGSGIGVSGFAQELSNPTSYSCNIVGNKLHHNSKYGLAFQSSTCTISGNVITNNGDSSFNGGVLLNAQNVSFTGNTVADNSHYGIDAGGCQNVIISGNLVRDNVFSGSGGAGISLGDSTFTNVVGNTLIGNGDTGGGGNIFLRGIDGGAGLPAFATQGGQCSVKSNMIQLANSLQYGIQATQGDTRGYHVGDNTVYGGSSSRAYSYESRFVTARNNTHFADLISSYPSVAFATNLIIPDDGTEIIDVSGTGTVSQIQSVSMQIYTQKVRGVYMTAFGSGYSAGTTASFSGGGGSGATAAVLVTNGQLRAINVTALGTGYTSSPTITLANTGGGSGASWTVYTECPNIYGRIIRIRGLTGLAVSSTNNIQLTGGATWSANGSNFLTLMGMFNGIWMEVSRS